MHAAITTLLQTGDRFFVPYALFTVAIVCLDTFLQSFHHALFQPSVTLQPLCHLIITFSVVKLSGLTVLYVISINFTKLSMVANLLYSKKDFREKNLGTVLFKKYIFL
jgi:hypothetical protein